MELPSIIKFDVLLKPIEEANPAGKPLKYTPAYNKLKEARREAATPKVDDAGELVVGWTGNWRPIAATASDLLSKESKDLEIAVWLTEALTRLYGFIGLYNGLRLLVEIQKEFWETLYPEIDEDDGVEARAGAVAILEHPRFPPVLLEQPLTQQIGGKGPYTWLDWDRARNVPPAPAKKQAPQPRGQAPAQPEPEVVTSEDFKNVADQTSPDFYLQTGAILDGCWEQYEKLCDLMDEKYGEDALTLEPLRDALEKCRDLVDRRRQKDPEESGEEDRLPVESDGLMEPVLPTIPIAPAQKVAVPPPNTTQTPPSPSAGTQARANAPGAAVTAGSGAPASASAAQAASAATTQGGTAAPNPSASAASTNAAPAASTNSAPAVSTNAPSAASANAAPAASTNAAPAASTNAAPAASTNAAPAASAGIATGSQVPSTPTAVPPPSVPKASVSPSNPPPSAVPPASTPRPASAPQTPVTPPAPAAGAASTIERPKMDGTYGASKVPPSGSLTPAPGGPPPVVHGTVPRSSADTSWEPKNPQDVPAIVARLAEYARKSDPRNPMAYRLARALRWGELRRYAPPVRSEHLSPPSTELRLELRTLFQANRWKELLEKAEAAVAAPEGRGWLDLQFYVHTACVHLGEEFEPLARFIADETRHLLEEVPGLPEAELADGTPCASPSSRAWIRDVIRLPGPASSCAAEGEEPKGEKAASELPGAGEEGTANESTFSSRWDSAMSLLEADRFPEGLKVLQEGLYQAHSGRERFLCQLEIAELCLAGEKLELANPILSELAAQAEQRRLDDWEDTQICSRLWSAVYASKEASGAQRQADPGGRKVFEHLCRIDINRALAHLKNTEK